MPPHACSANLPDKIQTSLWVSFVFVHKFIIPWASQEGIRFGCEETQFLSED